MSPRKTHKSALVLLTVVGGLAVALPAFINSAVAQSTITAQPPDTKNLKTGKTVGLPDNKNPKTTKTIEPPENKIPKTGKAIGPPDNKNPKTTKTVEPPENKILKTTK